MSKSSYRRLPLTVTYQPATRCQLCDRTIACRLAEHCHRGGARRPSSKTPGQPSL